ncbi:MAG: DNA repair protein RadC [Clostridiales bacterium]|nr:DNA repair protein RadC [Clostridiales bacterium]
MHEGHRERLKGRFREEGLDSFNQHQVLELLLFYAIPRKDTNEIAHELIKRFGSLSGVLDAGYEHLTKEAGLTPNVATLLTLLPDLCRRYLNDKWGDKPQLNSTSKAGEYAKTLFYGRPYEVFYVICLDAQNQVNYAALAHEGTIDSAPIYPRIIVEAALRHKATSIILAHNHPGGSLQPSSADIDATKKIKAACEAISVSVVDHVIVAGEKYFSFADRGLI